MKYILSLVLLTAFVPYGQANWSKDKHVKSSSIQFEKGAYMLSADQKKQIDDVVRKVKESDDYQLDVAVWSDQPFPAQGTELSSDQQELASQRIEAIKDYLGTLNLKGDMEAYNMAEGANWLSRLFNSSESELKSAFAKRDTNTSIMKQRYQTFKKEGKPNKAVFVISRDDD